MCTKRKREALEENENQQKMSKLDKFSQLEIEAIFKFLDKDGDGVVTFVDMIYAAGEINEDLCEKDIMDMLNAANFDNSGNIGLHNFQKLIDALGISD
jgi:Ca2+-binding EF-hand superfamily protein